VALPGESSAVAETQASGQPLRIDVLGTAYDVSGKPAQGCTVFDNRVPTRRLTLRLAIVNGTGSDVPAAEWGAAAFSGNTRAVLCLAGDARQLPVLSRDNPQPVTLVAFVAPDQMVSRLQLRLKSGAVADVCFDQEQVVDCPAT
jgi:hypothetical protein